VSRIIGLPRIAVLAGVVGLAVAPGARGEDPLSGPTVDLGARPRALVEDMAPGPLKDALQACAADELRRTDFSIAHRGAPLGFPEHTRESYEAAARMGAGILECDVTFTRDLELVCRHSQCDLHTTTNILATPLATKCARPFEPAMVSDDGALVRPASARCCTSDLTLEEFRSLEGRRDVSNPAAGSVEEYLGPPPGDPVDVKGVPGGEVVHRGTLMTHAESIALFQRLGVKMTPELKEASVAMPFRGLGQEDYARKLIDAYRDAGVPPDQVWPQSFSLDDVLFWIEHEPAFGRQAIYLDGRGSGPGFDPSDPDTWAPTMEELAARGVRVIAPPIWVLLTVEDGAIVPSVYARRARAAGLEIITWTLERSGSLDGGGGFYYQSVADVIDNDGDVFEVLDVLARQVGIIGVFSDWPATVTCYANCMERRRRDRSE
jgi:glycerophosphoryl diester phosphodiesterase